MNDEVKFQFDIYQSRFKRPLRTSHGLWQIREGIIIKLTNRAGIVTQGEIAPLPWFGSETMERAREFCQQQKGYIDRAAINLIPDSLPCCQFALKSAWLNLDRDPLANPTRELDYCYLLPAGAQSLVTWKHLHQTQSASTFKWKIGVYPLTEEIKILQQLTREFPADIKLRLDANGGLNLPQAHQLLSITDHLQGIEFIEQPLSSNSFVDILQLSQEHSTPLALDESVASFSQLQLAYQQGWQGVYVVKAAIMGFPDRLMQFCQNRDLDVVFSSVFETEVGREAILRMAQSLPHSRAVGFGVQHWFE